MHAMVFRAVGILCMNSYRRSKNEIVFPLKAFVQKSNDIGSNNYFCIWAAPRQNIYVLSSLLG